MNDKLPNGADLGGANAPALYLKRAKFCFIVSIIGNSISIVSWIIVLILEHHK